MKKVFIMNHGLASGGTDTFVSNVSKGLYKDKYDVSIVMALDNDGSKQYREDEVLDAGIAVYRTCDLGSAKRILLHAYLLYKILRQNSVDIFHTNMDLFNGVNCFVAWLARCPIRVCHCHTAASQYESQTDKHTLVGIYRAVMRILCRLFSNRKCGCSPLAMDYLFGKRWITLPQTYIINNGIDTSRFRNNIKFKYSINKKTIATVGRLSASKNPLFALETIEELSKIRQDFKYIWVGGGELSDEVCKSIEAKGLTQYVQLLGVRNDIDSILAGCDVFLLPSIFEGFGIVLIEAQASGLPCIVSDSVPRDADCGGCKFLSLDAPASEWAQALSDVLDGNYQYSIDQAKLDTFDISYMIHQLEKVYSA